jgi:hypothetical protein
MMIRIAVLVVSLFVAANVSAAAEDGPLYKDDPAIAGKIKELGDRSAVMLGKFKVKPDDAAKSHHALKNGPGRRDYGNKMPYAPDRGTAMYCGANHNVPHRLNDVWEFHLGSNTWHLICKPGTNGSALRAWSNRAGKARKAIKAGKDVEKNKAFLKGEYADYARKWWSRCTVADGYLQDKANGGPVQPWHTWDGVTYDEGTKRLYWAVLDSDNFKQAKHRVHINKTRNYAKSTGQDPAKLVAQLKPGTSMYMYDPSKKRWFKQLGEGPFPIMRGMGGTLHYLPDIDKTIWYACVGNTPGGYDEGMWSYDATANKWTNLIPGGKLRGMVYTKKIAPGGELQVAYSPKHKKLVAVYKTGTFVYDVAKNTWARAADNPSHGHDSVSVFAYDSHADVFLFVGKKGGRWSTKPWTLSAYDLKTGKWEVVKIKGAQLPQDPPKRHWLAQQYSGYYDPGHNAFVLYVGRSSRTWAYRHKAAE